VLAGAYSGATLSEPLAGLLETLPGLESGAGTLAFVLVVVATTYVSLIIGELVPKRLALANAERIAAFVAVPMRGLAAIGAPIVWFLRVSTEGALRLLGAHRTPENKVSQEEIKSLIAEGTEHGTFDPAEREMLDGVMRFADRSVRGVMTPRFELAWLDVGASVADFKRLIAETGYSRYPLCRGSIDEIVGVVQANDLLVALPDGDGPLPDLASIARQPLVVHDSTRALKLIEMFRGSPTHFAVVVDEYGSVEGIVTLNDVLQAIAGDIPEPDAEHDPAVVRREDGSLLVDGLTPADHVAHLLGVRRLSDEGGRDDDFETLAGFILWRLGHLPQVAETLDWEGYRFEVIDLDGRRIDKVLIRPLETADSTAAASSDGSHI
jgi:putative hemolysin